MLRSMYSGVSGMKNFQTKLDVIGNNIANVNTYGYKKGRITFQDLITQQIAGSQAPTETKGGVNAKQVGLGSTISTIDTLHTAGSLQITSRSLDLALTGEGFFIVAAIKDPAQVNIDANGVSEDNQITGPLNEAMDLNFTRAGNFYMDQDGYLVTAEGFYVLGDTGAKATTTPPTWGDATSGQTGLIQIPKTAKSFSIAQDGMVTFINENGILNTAGQLQVASFSNPGGLEKSGGNLYRLTANSGALDKNVDGIIDIADLVTPGTEGTGSLLSGALEMSNVDLSEEFTEMIVAQRGFQSNTKIITTSDEILQELVNLKR
ncbi:flagellar basal body rod protein FlgG [Litchfieldia alkalitelluris]|uniref:flagellar basal body rod protein FlgG n=1 Tax=Litchfieldia alkalitelluris TaxID=304268 RepID=UPI000998B53B|nr:flagellar basal body rod protein FlgG [Litchfieldia alkalitelluris]